MNIKVNTLCRIAKKKKHNRKSEYVKFSILLLQNALYHSLEGTNIRMKRTYV